MISALLIIGAIFFLFESAGFLYCAVRNVPFGSAFGSAMFIQVSLPAAFLGLALGWEYFSPTTAGIEPFAGTGFARGLGLYYGFLMTGFGATVLAGTLGVFRIFRQANGSDRRGAQVLG